MRQVIFAMLGVAAVGLGGCQSLQGYPAPLETPKQALALVQADLTNLIHGDSATQKNALIACLTAAGEKL